MREFVLGDIHGGYKSLIQVFERSKFDYNNDKLIVIGDIADGWPETKKCVEELTSMSSNSGAK